MLDIRTDHLNGEVGLDDKINKPENFDHLIDELPRRGNPTPNNLVVHRWHHPTPDSGENADLIRRAKSGDGPAKTRLIENYHRAILPIARKYIPDPKLKLDSPYFGDLVAAGVIGFLVALYRYDTRRNNGLWAYAQHYVEDEIRKEARKWKKNGLAGETRIERWIYSHPYDTPEQVAYALSKRGIRCTPEAAAKAIEAVSCRRSPQTYSTTTEGGYSDDIDRKKSTGAAVKAAGSHDMHQMYGCFSRYQLSSQLRLHEATSRTVDALVVALDKRAERRLRAIGRRAYALKIMRREPIPQPEIQMAVYAIPINTAATASDSADWKSDLDRFGVAAQTQPTVFDVKDQWGWYRSRKDHRPKNETYQAEAAMAA